jgi:hypothetical protein
MIIELIKKKVYFKKNYRTKMKQKKSAKKYDAVKEMRKIRDKISTEISDMNAEQIIAYFKRPCSINSNRQTTNKK